MRLLLAFARMYPRDSGLMLAALLFAGIAEGFGFSALLPLLSTVQMPGMAPMGGISGKGAALSRYVTGIVEALGLKPTIGVLLCLMVGCIILKSGFMLLANKRVGFTVAHVATDQRLELLRALLAARWEYYLSQPVGGLTNAFATEAMRTSQAYLCGARMATLCMHVVIYATVALLVSWRTTLGSMVAGVILLFGLSRLVRMARRAGKRQTKLLHSLLSRLADSLQSIKPLKAMGRENLADAVLAAETYQLNRALQKQVLSKEALRSLQEPMLVIFLAIGLYVALVHWGLPLATVTVLAFLLARLLTQLNKVQEEYQKMMEFESAYWSLRKKIVSARQEQEPALGMRKPSLANGIRFDDVSFRYAEPWVLTHTSLEFPAGLFTAITGPSGSGKTTVVDLIMGLVRPQQGEIWIDRLPLAEIDLRTWRHMVGYVPQETLLLHDTVLRNVSLGDSAISLEDVERALRMAGAWEFVERLPQGLQTVVGERGGKLSGGQRQRISIARALVQKPALLILDEATSGLDPESAEGIALTLSALRGMVTIIAICHQSALVHAADRICCVSGGKVTMVPAGGEAERICGVHEADDT